MQDPLKIVFVTGQDGVERISYPEASLIHGPGAVYCKSSLPHSRLGPGPASSLDMLAFLAAQIYQDL